tara:strand:+ start:891 stop:1112 length:222 start_codon:yes stop_codon:yes gene_type:complete
MEEFTGIVVSGAFRQILEKAEQDAAIWGTDRGVQETPDPQPHGRLRQQSEVCCRGLRVAYDQCRYHHREYANR